MSFKIFRPLDHRLTTELKGQRKTILLGLVCVILTALLTSATIPLVHWAVEAIQRKSLERLAWMCLGIIGIYAVKYWFTRGQVYFLSKAATRLTSELRVKLFRKLQRLPISYFNERRAGAVQSVLTNDVNVFQSAVTIVRDSIDGPVKAISAFVTIAVMKWQLAVVAILFIPVLAYVIQRNARKMRTAQTSVQSDLSDLNAMTQEALLGTRVVKAFSAEDRVTKTYEGLVERSFESQMRAIRRLASLRPLVEVIGAVALATILYLCGVMVANDQLKIPEIAALIFAMDVINQGARTLGYASNAYSQVQAAADRIYGEILDVPEKHIDEPGALELEAPKGLIEFKGVSFVYPDGTQALNKVSFTVEPSKSLAMVGPSGAGKSTIADLLLRFYDPTDGEILFDGVNIRQLKAAWLRAQIGVVPQQTFLFAGSIAENIRMGKETASDEEVAEAATAAHATGFIDEMPERYQTELGESGVRLSGGERQRIAIARAFVKKPKLLLLDEATSNLDAVSEKAVQEALEEIMKGRTTLFIAHRLTSAARADKILMLSRGEVVEFGSHKELIKKNGAYAGMYRAFSSGVIDDIG